MYRYRALLVGFLVVVSFLLGAAAMLPTLNAKDAEIRRQNILITDYQNQQKASADVLEKICGTGSLPSYCDVR